jgi:hypothetical protein
MNVPIIRLELDRMKYSIIAALNQHVLNIDDQVQKSIDQFATEENLGNIIQKIVREEINSAVTEEVQRFFRYSGLGRAAIREAVEQHMNDVYPVEVLK